MTASERTRRRVIEAPRKTRAELRGVRVIFEPDPEPDTSYLEQDEFVDRRESYEAEEFSFVQTRAEADVTIEGIEQTLTSGGLAGIESDSSEEYINELAAAEWAELRKVLKTVGVPTSELPLEVDPKWVEWRM